MTPLGKSLVFYLKYMAEMNHLCGDVASEDEEHDLAGLKDAKQVRQMARTVGAAASEQAAEFLQACGKGIKDHFTGLGVATLAHEKKWASIVKNWSWGAWVEVAAVPGGSFFCGVWITAPPEVRISIERDVCGVLVPFLWSSGHKGEDTIWKILGDWADSRAGEGLVHDRGTVALARIPIRAQPVESFDVDREQLIAEVMKTFARIGAEQTKAIASIVAGCNEQDIG